MPAAAVAAAHRAAGLDARRARSTLADSDGRLFRVVDSAVADHVRRPISCSTGGEGEKSAAGLERLWRAFAEAGLERGDRVLAVGGGAVTDVVGFAAATFRRGIAWIAGPDDARRPGRRGDRRARRRSTSPRRTTSARSGRRRVCSQTRTCSRRCPQREWAARLRRVREDGAARRWPAVGSRPRGSARERPGCRGYRRSSCGAAAGFKALVVAQDPRETGQRAILNLGHTIGHGVEAAAGYESLRHGEAVAIGLVAALRLSTRIAGLDPAIAAEVEQLLAGAGPADARAGPRAGRGARGDAARQEARARRASLRAARAASAGRSSASGWRTTCWREVVAAAVSGRRVGSTACTFTS